MPHNRDTVGCAEQPHHPARVPTERQLRDARASPIDRAFRLCRHRGSGMGDQSCDRDRSRHRRGGRCRHQLVLSIHQYHRAHQRRRSVHLPNIPGWAIRRDGTQQGDRRAGGVTHRWGIELQFSTLWNGGASIAFYAAREKRSGTTGERRHPYMGKNACITQHYSAHQCHRPPPTSPPRRPPQIRPCRRWCRLP